MTHVLHTFDRDLTVQGLLAGQVFGRRILLDQQPRLYGWVDDGSVVRLATAADAVSIGANAIAANLGTPAVPVLQVAGPAAAVAAQHLHAYGSLAQLDSYRTNGTEGSKSAVATGDQVGRYRFNAWDGGAYRTLATLFADVLLFTAADDLSGIFKFFVRAPGVGASNAERMRLTSAGLKVDPAGGAVSPTSALDVAGPIALASVSTAIDITLDGTHSTVRVDTTGGNRIITLPTAVGINGRIYVIKRITGGAFTLTVDAAGAETIDGNLTVLLPNQWDVLRIQSDNAGWLIL